MGGRDKWRLLIGRRLAATAGRDLKFHKIVLNMSHGNGSSAFIFQVTGILKPVTLLQTKGYNFPTQTWYGIIHFMGQILISKLPILKIYKIVLNMSHGNGSSAFIFQVTGILKPVTDSTDKMLKLSHSNMAGCNSLYGSNFDFRET